MQTCAISADSLGRMLESFLAEVPARHRHRKRRTPLRLRHRALLRLRRRQMRAASLVRGAQRRPPRARRRTEAAATAPQRIALRQVATRILEISADRDQRTPTALRAIRSRYRQIFERVLLRRFPGYKLDSLSSRADLEHSCSPVYTRGRAAPGPIGVCRPRRQRRRNPALHRRRAHLRHSLDGPPARAACRSRPRRRPEALRCPPDAPKWFASAWPTSIAMPPSGSSTNSTSAPKPASPSIATTPATSSPAWCAPSMSPLPDARFAASIARMQSLAPDCEAHVESPSEIVFRLHGLEFARARMAPVARLIPQRRGDHLRTLARRSTRSTTRTKPISATWSHASPSTATRTASTAIRSFAPAPSAGWNR